jgi:membrane protein
MPTAGGVQDELNHYEKYIWELVSMSPAKNLWELKDVSLRDLAKRTWKAMLHDRLLSIGAELGFWFAFAVFPALICAATIMGLAARSATNIYDKLLTYLGLIVPQSALGMVMQVFHQTTAHSNSGKLTFGLLATIWSASVGVSAIQDATNAVYKIVERRSYLKARFQAILLTLLLTCTVTLCLASLFAGDFASAWLHHHMQQHFVSDTTVTVVRVCGWVVAAAFLALSFAALYYWAPDLRKPQWHWITPGATLGVAGWLLVSIGFRIYLHYFNTYSVTYGSLGAFIILLMWFYITGLMILLGAEFNSELEAAAMEAKVRREKAEGKQHPGIPQSITPAA